MTNNLIRNKQHNKDLSIQVIRVVAMLMIAFDHILCNISFPLQAVIVQVFNSGVFIFLFISGLLFGDKKVTNWKLWYISRLKRIIIPLWIFAAVDLIIEQILWNNFKIENVFIFTFNLQGIFLSTTGAINLWFVTLILICYLLNPILQYIKKRQKIIKFLIPIVVLLQIVMAYVTDIGLVNAHNISWCLLALIVYTLGYLIGLSNIKNIITIRNMMIFTVIAAIASFIVVIARTRIDGTILYDRLIMPYGMLTIDIVIISVLYTLTRNIKNYLFGNIVDFFDNISYEFYLVHGLIMTSLTNKWLEMHGVVIYVFGTIVISIISALVLKIIVNLILGIKVRKWERK